MIDNNDSGEMVTAHSNAGVSATKGISRCRVLRSVIDKGITRANLASLLSCQQNEQSEGNDSHGGGDWVTCQQEADSAAL